MAYSLTISKTAEKQLKKIPKTYQLKISAAILALAQNPWPHGSKKLHGHEDTYRIRIGTYRVIYCVEKKNIEIVVLKIGHRKDIYGLL